MPRRNTVNFLQIEHGLESALRACVDNPGAPYVERHHGHLEVISTNLGEATKQTDHAYLAWRSGMARRLLAAKHLSKRFDELRDEVGEFGVAARPAGRVGYWDPELLLASVREFVAQLASVGAKAPEAEDWAGELRQMAQGLERALREEEQALEDYKRIAPLRRQAIYSAMHAIDEFDAVRKDYES